VNREQGTWNREQGTGNREQGTGNREQGTGKIKEKCSSSFILIALRGVNHTPEF